MIIQESTWYNLELGECSVSIRFPSCLSLYLLQLESGPVSLQRGDILSPFGFLQLSIKPVLVLPLLPP